MHELYEYGIFQFLLTDAIIYLIEDNTQFLKESGC